MEYIVRDMEAKDIDQILEIESVSFPAPWSRETFISELQNPLSVYLVADNDGTVLGYAGIWIIFDEGHITNVAVHPDYKGNRVGETLLGEMEAIILGNGGKMMTLEVRPSNQPALILYNRFNFKRVGLRKGYYTDNNEDAIIMTKELESNY